MRTLVQWLDSYGQSHKHPVNILLHKICVPTIVFTVYGMLWTVPLPDSLRGLIRIGNIGYANLASLTLAAGLLFYLRLSLRMAAGMAMMSVTMLALLGWLEARGVDIALLSLCLFVLAWIGQFVGHKIEGKKPSFFEDLQFLLIGPAWTLAALYRALGIRY
jgi:uncharacterized membrane protein YGL010W